MWFCLLQCQKNFNISTHSTLYKYLTVWASLSLQSHIGSTAAQSRDNKNNQAHLESQDKLHETQVSSNFFPQALKWNLVWINRNTFLGSWLTLRFIIRRHFLDCGNISFLQLKHWGNDPPLIKRVPSKVPTFKKAIKLLIRCNVQTHNSISSLSYWSWSAQRGYVTNHS